jgi:hypothetical protein
MSAVTAKTTYAMIHCFGRCPRLRSASLTIVTPLSSLVPPPTEILNAFFNISRQCD